jgi:hypothetical protein
VASIDLAYCSYRPLLRAQIPNQEERTRAVRPNQNRQSISHRKRLLVPTRRIHRDTSDSKICCVIRDGCGTKTRARCCSQRCRRLAKISAASRMSVLASTANASSWMQVASAKRYSMVPQAPASLTTIAKRANSRRCLAKTEEAIDLFIAHRKIASCDPLQPYGYLNIALSLIFKIARE